MDQVGIGLVGSGYMGRSYAECLSRYTSNGRLAAVVGGSRAAQLAADYQIPEEPTLDSLLHRADVDAVIIATPHSLHVSQACAAAAAGKHVYLEKPMALNVAQCDEIIAAAALNGVVVAVNSVMRFRDAPVHAKTLLGQGAIGDLRMVLGRHVHSRFLLAEDSWTSDPREGSRYLDWGVHANDQLRWYSGSEPRRVYASYATFGTGPYPQTAMAQFTMASGVLAHVWMTYEVPRPGFGPSDTWILIGSEGLIECDNYGDVRLGRGDRWDTVFTQPAVDYLDSYINAHRLKAFAAQTQDFMDSIREGRPPAVTAQDGRAAVEMVEAVDGSASTGLSITFGAAPLLEPL